MNRRWPAKVYFIRRADGEGPVKIGCSGLPELRLKSLFPWSPYPLTVVATILGDEKLERRFHHLFEADYSHSEWFKPSAHMEEVIAAVAAGTFDVSTLPPPKLVGRKPAKPWTEEQRAVVKTTNALRKLRKVGFDGHPLWAPTNGRQSWLASAGAFIAAHADALTPTKRRRPHSNPAQRIQGASV